MTHRNIHTANALFSQLERWKEQGTITAEQYELLYGRCIRNPCSVFLELNILIYAGVLAFIAGLGWTVQTYSQQLGDGVILCVLTGILAACLWYCFSRTAPNLYQDYVLYLGCLTWTIELAWFETRLHLLSGQWDDYLLATALLFLVLAYRFNNRFVLSLALSALAGWFGLALTRGPDSYQANYRPYAVIYSLLIAVVGAGLSWKAIRPQFLGTYLNVAANILFAAIFSGIFDSASGLWLLILFLCCAASLGWGIWRKQLLFIIYAAVYGYIGVSSKVLLRGASETTVLIWFLFSGIYMAFCLVQITRRFGIER